jgi:hypothetical protein
MRILLLAAGLLLAGNARAGEHELKIYRSSAPITASVSFDENGKSITPAKGDATETPFIISGQTLQLETTTYAMKEPAVEWCENFGTLQQVYNKKWELIDQYHLYELCGMSDHSVIWRRKAK